MTAMIAFVDTSAFVPLFITDEPRDLIDSVFDEVETFACSRLASVEMTKVLRRREQAGQISASQGRRLAAAFEEWFSGCYVLDLNRAVARSASAVIRRHGLKVADAVHLTTALLIRDDSQEEVVFCTADLELRAAAANEGFRTPT